VVFLLFISFVKFSIAEDETAELVGVVTAVEDGLTVVFVVVLVVVVVFVVTGGFNGS